MHYRCRGEGAGCYISGSRQIYGAGACICGISCRQPGCKRLSVFKVFDDHQLEYILLANGDSDDVYMVGKIASFQIQNLLVAYKERFDKDNFIKNLLLDNLLLVDIYNRAKKLHIDTEVRRVVFIVRPTATKTAMNWSASVAFSVERPKILSQQWMRKISLL